MAAEVCCSDLCVLGLLPIPAQMAIQPASQPMNAWARDASSQSLSMQSAIANDAPLTEADAEADAEADVVYRLGEGFPRGVQGGWPRRASRHSSH